MELPKKASFVKEYWQQLTGIIGAVAFLAIVYSQFRTLQQEFADFQKNSKERNQALIERIDKMAEYLNGEDDGVRGDFNAADAAQDKLEAMRERATQAELKVWVLENFDKQK